MSLGHVNNVMFGSEAEKLIAKSYNGVNAVLAWLEQGCKYVRRFPKNESTTPTIMSVKFRGF